MPRKKNMPSPEELNEDEDLDENADSTPEIDLDSWPELPSGSARPIYYRGNFSKEMVQTLKFRGYDPVDLITLPRKSDEEQIRYLLAKAQALEEGTVFATPEERRQLALNMHAFGMLNSKSVSINVRESVVSNDVEAILDWQNSRHTFKDNSTVDITGRTPEELRSESHRRVAEAREAAEEKVKKLHGNNDTGKKSRRQIGLKGRSPFSKKEKKCTQE